MGKSTAIVDGAERRIEPVGNAGGNHVAGIFGVGFLTGKSIELRCGTDHQGRVVGPLGLLEGAVEAEGVPVEAVGGVLEVGVDPGVEALRELEVGGVGGDLVEAEGGADGGGVGAGGGAFCPS